jgi:hypothetical protein
MVIIAVIFNAWWYIAIPIIIVMTIAVVVCIYALRSDSVETAPRPTFRQTSFRSGIDVGTVPRQAEPRGERRLRGRVEREWERQSRFGDAEDLV